MQHNLDIIVPLYNEEGNIIPLYNKIKETLKSINYSIIFINDGSIDTSYKVLEELYNKDKKHIKVINFSRNFGKEAAMYAGLKNSTSDYAVIIDADLQHDPKYILDMYNYLETHPEFDEIAAVNKYEKEFFIKRLLKRTFYKIISRLSGLDLKIGASDFRMFRNYVVNSLIEMSEYNRFSKGLFAYIGFNIYYMDYEPNKRLSGKSKFKLNKQISYAKDGILSTSTKPLKIANVVGTLLSISSFIYLIVIVLQTLIYGKDIPGYASLMCIMLLLGGIELLVLGILGEYISRIYNEVKNRPIYIEKNTLGIKNKSKD